MILMKKTKLYYTEWHYQKTFWNKYDNWHILIHRNITLKAVLFDGSETVTVNRRETQREEAAEKKKVRVAVGS